MPEDSEDFQPRNYQLELMKVGLQQNTIVFLPTGAGKTFIALLILKRMSKSIQKSYSSGGKISIILVNTVALVDQHANYITDHTILKVGKYSGEQKPDLWSQSRWCEEFNRYQVLVMTTQIFYNMVISSFIDLNKVNLLVFDECHHGVKDQMMRQVMKAFQHLHDPPRVIGLTATLLNKSCDPRKVFEEVDKLETTFHSTIATVDGLSEVTGYATNPIETITFFKKHTLSPTEADVKAVLDKLVVTMNRLKSNNSDNSRLKDKKSFVQKQTNFINECIFHLTTMGIIGGITALTAHAIQIEKLRRIHVETNESIMWNYVQTTLSHAKLLLSNHIASCEKNLQLLNHSSDKILKLIAIIKDCYNNRELCGIIFTEKRLTARIIYHLLDNLSKNNSEFSFIKCDYIVGCNSNPFDCNIESLFASKKNKQVLSNFANKEINLLVATNILEEGIDIPRCTLVIKYDQPKDYRSYVQSKGRGRHRDSLYYILVETLDMDKFYEKYSQHQLIEKTLNDHLVGNTSRRSLPSQHEIEKMYNEDEIPPYFVSGPGSPQVNMRTAIPLLSQYCQQLPSDLYTNYAPDWFVEEKLINGEKYFSVDIILPMVCPILENIKGELMKSIKSAKRAAALKACIKLHEIGELDDNLVPNIRVIPDENVTFLFKHYPACAESHAGTSKSRRMHLKYTSSWVKGEIKSNTQYFLHVIELEPQFSSQNQNVVTSTMYNSYISSLCYGFLTPKLLPSLCSFPVYVTLGRINVNIRLNVKQITLTDQDLADVKLFQHVVFREVLKIVGNYLIFDNSDKAEIILLVPVNRHNADIDYDILRKRHEVRLPRELSEEEKNCLDTKTYHNRIITPYYRNEVTNYIVMEVCSDKNAFTPFPSPNYNTFLEYYKLRYSLTATRPKLPLLLAKGVTKEFNFTKPKGSKAKRKHEEMTGEREEYLLQEFVVVHDFPSSLWIQANFIPTIFSRLSFMLNIEEIRRQIATEAKLGMEIMYDQPPLVLDKYLLGYTTSLEDETINESCEITNLTATFDEVSVLKSGLQIDKNYMAKVIEAKYPWKDSEEPKDLSRNLDVNLKDIEEYENFITTPDLLQDDCSYEQLLLVVDSEKEHFVHKPIGLLECKPLANGPAICDLYQALTSAKAMDIVNLERLETLGDSFLKLIASIYVNLRFNRYDEGRMTELKGRLVSNKNLFYLANKKSLGGVMQFDQLSPKHNWLPPTFTIPAQMLQRIEKREVSMQALTNIKMSTKEMVTGNLREDTVKEILNHNHPIEKNEEDFYKGFANLLKKQYVGDKQVADAVESLLGCYFQFCGFHGGVKFVEWMGIIPKSENLEALLNQTPANPILKPGATQDDIEFHIPDLGDIEDVIGYRFENRGFLLQAMTHPSYTINRITLSYENLEFLGDAVLDFLVTCYIFESCGNLNPGELTDLRSALVNNNTFASLAVRYNLQKHLLLSSSKLQSYIDKFVEYLRSRDYQISDEVLVLLSEDELQVAESVEIPKVLGDIFESLAGAIYLDCGKDLTVVWEVFYKLMWKEIENFSRDIPINAIRRLNEMQNIKATFGKAEVAKNEKCLVPLKFLHNNCFKVVYGCGANTTVARKAAAKLALRVLEKESGK